MYVVSIKILIRKKSGNLSYAPRILQKLSGVIEAIYPPPTQGENDEIIYGSSSMERKG